MDIARIDRRKTVEMGELCLGHLAQDPELLGQFMAIAGYDPAGLRAALGSEALARGLIDYFAANEPLMLAFCGANDIKPASFMRVWHSLNPAE